MNAMRWLRNNTLPRVGTGGKALTGPPRDKQIKRAPATKRNKGSNPEKQKE